MKSHAGVIVTISREGDVEVIRGLVRGADRRAVAAAERSMRKLADSAAEADASRGDEGLDGVSENTEPRIDQGALPLAARPQGRAPGCTEALARRLAAHRTMALQAMLARNPAVALAVVVHAFVLRVFGPDYPREASALKVSAQTSGYALEAAADDLKASSAWQVVQQAKAAWRARLPERQGEWLQWLIGLAQAELVELLALCGASTLNALPDADAPAQTHAIAVALGLDMADWWEPTAEGYLKHVSKAQIVQALQEAGPQLCGGGIEAMKKDALVNTAASRLAGTRWLPPLLRRVPA